MVQGCPSGFAERRRDLVPQESEYVHLYDPSRKSLTTFPTVSGVPANFTMPQNIAPGNYIFRQEIIALHLANEKGGAEFYPSCSRITVSGSGTGTPTDDELVSLPGAYSDTDPGIYVPGVSDTSDSAWHSPY